MLSRYGSCMKTNRKNRRMLRFFTLLLSAPRSLVQAAGLVLGAVALSLIPLFGYVQAAGRHTSATATRSSTNVAIRAAARQAANKPRSVAAASKSSASVGTLETVVETLNNCGPAAVASVLAYYHIYRTQAQVQAILRADNSYWGMSPVDLPAYTRSFGLRALVGYGGTEKLIKLLIANGFPVIASQYVSSSYQIRHYRPIEAYDDRTGTFVSADPLLGAGHVISYGEFDSIWAESDYRFQVIYLSSRQTRLDAVLRAAGWNKTRTYTQAIRWEEQQMQSADFQNPGSWIWYNGYADIAFDEAQLGQFKKAEAALAAARRQGISPVLINWVSQEIAAQQHHG